MTFDIPVVHFLNLHFLPYLVENRFHSFWKHNYLHLESWLWNSCRVLNALKEHFSRNTDV